MLVELANKPLPYNNMYRSNTTKYITIFLLLLICFSANAKRRKKAYGHNHNSRLVDAAFLMSPNGMGGKAGFTLNNRNFTISQYAISFESGIEDQMKFSVFAFDYNHMWTLIDLNKQLYFNIGPGAQVGFENLKSEISDETASGLMLGLSAKLEVEYFIKKLAIFGNAQQYYLPISNMANWRLRYSVGLKYVIQ